MNAFVAITDRDWFDFLAAREDVDEVNFWQPHPWSGRFGVLGRGEPLLFKLRAPVNAIVGGGFFEHYTTLPFSLAWRAFGPKNGLATQQAFWDPIARLRREQMASWEDPDIGCILLVEPFFWPVELWIPQPEEGACAATQSEWARSRLEFRTLSTRLASIRESVSAQCTDCWPHAGPGYSSYAPRHDYGYRQGRGYSYSYGHRRDRGHYRGSRHDDVVGSIFRTRR